MVIPDKPLPDLEFPKPKVFHYLHLSIQLTHVTVSPDGQVSSDLLLWHHLGNVLLGFILVVALHADLHKRLARGVELLEI